MPLSGKLLSGLCIHHIPQQKKFIMEMLNGILQWASLFSAIGKCPGNADGPHGIQPIRILYNLSLQSIRDISPVPAERNGIDTRADPLSLIS